MYIHIYIYIYIYTHTHTHTYMYYCVMGSVQKLPCENGSPNVYNILITKFKGAWVVKTGSKVANPSLLVNPSCLSSLIHVVYLIAFTCISSFCFFTNLAKMHVLWSHLGLKHFEHIAYRHQNVCVCVCVHVCVCVCVFCNVCCRWYIAVYLRCKYKEPLFIRPILK